MGHETQAISGRRTTTRSWTPMDTAQSHPAVPFCEKLDSRLLVARDDSVALGDAAAVNDLRKLLKRLDSLLRLEKAIVNRNRYY